MLDKRIIDGEIANLEKEKMSMSNLQKLAILYQCRDHIENEEHKHEDVAVVEKSYNEPKHMEETKIFMVGEPSKKVRESELAEATKDKNRDDVLKVLDEHMEIVKEFMPKEHKALMEKLKSI